MAGSNVTNWSSLASRAFIASSSLVISEEARASSWRSASRLGRVYSVEDPLGHPPQRGIALFYVDDMPSGACSEARLEPSHEVALAGTLLALDEEQQRLVRGDRPGEGAQDVALAHLGEVADSVLGGPAVTGGSPGTARRPAGHPPPGRPTSTWVAKSIAARLQQTRLALTGHLA